MSGRNGHPQPHLDALVGGRGAWDRPDPRLHIRDPHDPFLGGLQGKGRGGGADREAGQPGT